MIGMLIGIVELKDSPSVFINVNGVGYKVAVSPNLFSMLKIGEKTKVFTYTHVREDLLELYGFAEALDLKLFENLIGVSGVGPKTAIGIFASGERSQIVEAIIKGDVEFFTSVPRLGRKNAQKIIIELKNKFGSLEDLDLSEESSKEKDELLGVLKGLGFSPLEAREAAKNVDPSLETSEKVKQALKYLGR